MKTNNILYVLALSVLMLLLSACSPKVTVYGQPGTEIYSQDKFLGVIKQDGKVKVKLDNRYIGILESRRPGTFYNVPFGVNTKNSKHTWSRLFEWTLGGPTTIFFYPIGRECSEDTRDKNYAYLKNQQTNDDIVFVQPQFEYVQSEQPQENIPREATQTSRLRPAASASQNEATDSQRVNRNLNDNTSRISGTYSGNGTISLRNDVLENLNDIQVKIRRVNAEEVEVEIIEANGSSFFGAPVPYKLKSVAGRNSRNSDIVLEHKTIPSATITISRSGNLVYKNPRLEIDNVIYLFKIEASKSVR